MTVDTVLAALFGAALVAVGVLASALADRVRDLRTPREPVPRERSSRASSPSSPVARAAISVVESAELLCARPPAKPARVPRAEPKAPPSSEGGDDVIAALVAAGYKKSTAAEATWACGAGERASIEGWTAAALRRCARGGLS